MTVALVSPALFAEGPEPLTVRASTERTWQGIPGLERTPGGRLYACWFSGGAKEPAPENEVFLSYSDDQGKTFTAPLIVAGPRDASRAFDPTLWLDPEGRLWYIVNRGNKDDAVHDVHARVCDDPDAETPLWSKEFRVGFDEAPYAFRMNKPTVLSSGEWIMPVTHADEPIHAWFAGPKQLQGVGISTDQGKTWKLHGSLKAPHWALECMVTELKDGRLWMLIRTGAGFLWESHSDDKGRTWTEATASTITSPGSRFFIRRLDSGNLLLVNHYQFKGRSHLTARLSTDDGKTWNEGLLLDERSGVSYPDGVEDRDGVIRIVYDRNRQQEGEILMATFTEEDIAAGEDAVAVEPVSAAARLRQVINRLGDDDQPLATSLPDDWDAKQAADDVLRGLVQVTAPGVIGAHDAEMVMVGDHAYIVAEVNDEKAGESAAWPEIYSALSIVHLPSLKVEQVIPMAKSQQKFDNVTLPVGACFVPRILQRDDTTLRCYFASEQPGKRQSQMWCIDFDLERRTFDTKIDKAKLKTSLGTFDMRPDHFHADAAVVQGFDKPAKDYGLYLFDSFKRFDGQLYVAINNYPGKQNALALVHDDLTTFEIVGHYNQPHELNLSESAVNRLPDGSWLAICRQDGGTRNYTFTTSEDGKTWTPGEYREDWVPNGDSSKPTFDRFGELYYLGWQEKTQIDGVHRSVFNVDVSRDGKSWQRKYRFETTQSFQYPTFRQHNGAIWVCATQGDHSPSRKERIMFGKLEEVSSE